MKTKQFFLLLLSVVLFAACDHNKLSAPTGLQGHQMGNTIVLAWDRVEGAIQYEVWKNGLLNVVDNTTFKDQNPQNGYNTYEVKAINYSAKSQAAQLTVFFEGDVSNDNQHSTTPVASVKSQDIIGNWEIIPYGEASYNWYLQFNSDGTFLEEIGDKSPLKSYGVGVWSLQEGILNVQYYYFGGSRFFYLNNKKLHTIYITQYANTTAVFYLPESTVKDDYYFTLQRSSYLDQSFSGNVSVSSTSSVTKNQLVGTWLYVDRNGAYYYTFKDNNDYNRVYIYGFEVHEYNNYNGNYSLSNNTINATIHQLIEAFSSGENSAGFKRSDAYSTEQYTVQSCNGSSLVWKDNGILHRCIKVRLSPHEIDS